MSALPLASARLRKLWVPFQKNLFGWSIRCVDFTHIAASNTASDDVTN